MILRLCVLTGTKRWSMKRRKREGEREWSWVTPRGYLNFKEFDYCVGKIFDAFKISIGEKIFNMNEILLYPKI